MAKLINNKIAMFVLTLVLFVFFTVAESRTVLGVGFVKAKSAPTCDSVLGVSSGDTCFSIAKSFGLSTAEFDAINPNLNCAAFIVRRPMALCCRKCLIQRNPQLEQLWPNFLH